MSYDLYFHTREGAPTISEDDFVLHFAGRFGYRAAGEYANEDTGVYFTLTHESLGDGGETRSACVSFSLNLHRPHVFALEADFELCRLVTAFDLQVEDPQAGTNVGEYSITGFIEGWFQANRAAVHALAREGPRAPTLPWCEIERCWFWNFHRRNLQESLGKNVFVPRIMFGLRDDRVVTFCAWPDAIPVALPSVDLVAVARKELAPRRLFAGRHPTCCSFPNPHSIPSSRSFRGSSLTRVAVIATSPNPRPRSSSSFGICARAGRSQRTCRSIASSTRSCSWVRGLDCLHLGAEMAFRVAKWIGRERR